MSDDNGARNPPGEGAFYGRVWKRLVDPDCPSIPRPHYNHTDPETTELDLSHAQLCPRCMDFLMLLNDDGHEEQSALD